MWHRALHNIIIACMLLGWAVTARGQSHQPPARDYVENELIVKTSSDVPLDRLLPGVDKTAAEHWPHLALLNQTYRVEGITQLFPQLERSLHDECGAQRIHELERELLRVWRFRFPDGFDAAQALDAYRLTPHVEYVELNRLQRVARLPDDPLFNMQWALRNTGQTGGTPGADVHAAAAWDTTTGGREIIVAVVDTGVDYLHPDLAQNVWRNEGEIAGNGIDDDGNGFVDDVRGWDFVDEDAHFAWPGEDAEAPDNDPMDRHGHGTHCSGIIGAVTDNAYGVAGVVWRCRIMPTRAGFLTRIGLGAVPTASSSQAIVYAAANGAHVINMSYGSFWPSPSQYLAIRYASERGVVLVGAAGNDGIDLMHFPSGFPEVIGVIATDHDDHRLGFSNYGMWCDVAAPGSWIYSTLPRDHFYPMGGTSMAAPHVSGGVAMLRSYEPRFEPRDVRAVLLQSCDDLGEPGFDNQYAFGRMNLERALKFRVTDNVSAPTLRWTGEPGFEIDGVEPDGPTTRRLVRFEVTYADADGDFPRVTQLWLDLDGDGDYAPVERFMMAPVDPDALDFVAGKRYGLALYLPPTTSAALTYRFHFEDARFAASGVPAETGRLVVHTSAHSAAAHTRTAQ